MNLSPADAAVRKSPRPLRPSPSPRRCAAAPLRALAASALLVAAALGPAVASGAPPMALDLPAGIPAHDPLETVVDADERCQAVALRLSAREVRSLAAQAAPGQPDRPQAVAGDFSPWRAGPLPDLGTSDKARLVHLGCGFKDQGLNRAFEGATVSAQALYSFSDRRRAFVLLDRRQRMLFYKLQGN